MDPAVFVFEICVPVTASVIATGRVRLGSRTARRAVRTIYHGPYEGPGDAWGRFEAWIAANGYTAAPDLWECYVAGPESSADPGDWRTELNQPLAD